jgi:hypothetical protein
MPQEEKSQIIRIPHFIHTRTSSSDAVNQDKFIVHSVTKSYMPSCWEPKCRIPIASYHSFTECFCHMYDKIFLHKKAYKEAAFCPLHTEQLSDTIRNIRHDSSPNPFNILPDIKPYEDREDGNEIYTQASIGRTNFHPQSVSVTTLFADKQVVTLAPEIPGYCQKCETPTLFCPCPKE